MELIKILQQRCDIYSDLIEQFITTNIEIIRETTDENTKNKLSKLLYDINPSIKRIEELIQKQENLNIG